MCRLIDLRQYQRARLGLTKKRPPPRRAEFVTVGEVSAEILRRLME